MTSRGSEFDVAIVGAGPAGTSAAIRLARRGFSVTLIEQKRFPREKLCGEFISPECISHFRDLGVLDQINLAGAVELTETVFFARNGEFTTVKSEWFGQGTEALGLSRFEMDRLLMLRAVDVGVTVEEDFRVSSLIRAAHSVVGVSEKGGRSVSARLTVDATGRARVLARLAEDKIRQPAKKADFVAFKTHLTGVDIPDGRCEIYAYRGGYGGCSRVEAGRYNICFVVDSRLARDLGGDADRVLRDIVFKNTRARTAVKNASVSQPWLAVPISSYGRFDLSPAKGLLTIGDAGAFIDPFTGSGILLALESAEIASDVLIENAQSDFGHVADEYRRRHALAFDRRLRVSSLLRHAAFAPVLAESVIKILSASRSLSRLVAIATRRSAKS